VSGDTIIRATGLSKKFRRYASVAEGIKEALHPLRKKYHREFWALRDVSFEVRRGESVGIIGRNGSGKSTLLQIICGILQPTGGSVEVGGKVAALLELGAGFHPEFTGRENVFLQGALMGFTKEETEERFEEIASFADIGDFIEQPIRTYSSGMLVRLAFASAISVEPDILVVDEALSVGDMFFQAKCMHKIKTLMDSGVTILFVTHDISAVKALCAKCIYLHQGGMKAFGPSNEVIDTYMRERSGEAATAEMQPDTKAAMPALDEFEMVNGVFKENPEFARRVEGTRHGTGEARITEVELLDGDGNPVEEVEFNQEVTVRIHLKFEQEEELTVVYQIRDDKFIPVLESHSQLETDKLIHGMPGEKFIIDFITKTPLKDGNYNLVARLTRPIVQNRSVKNIDSIENVHVFRVLERSPHRIWAKVHIVNGIINNAILPHINKIFLY